jgi:hypothetical protein
VVVSATSNDTGAFLLPFLPPGRYRVTAEQTGFKTWSQSDLELRVNDSLALDIRLDLGSQTETIEVAAGTPLLETADASLGNVIDERGLQELPQRGGNPLELERLNPGVVNLTTLRIMKPASPERNVVDLRQRQRQFPDPVQSRWRHRHHQRPRPRLCARRFHPALHRT